MREVTLPIMSRRWRIVPVDGLCESYGVHGECDHVTTKKKAIRFDKDLSALDLLETLCHECHHAAFPDASEESVTLYNRHLARVITTFLDVQKKDLEQCASE